MSDAGLEALQRFREQGGHSGPPKTPWEKLAEHPTSMRKAITAKCHDCMGWGIDEPRPSGIVQDIRDCTSPRCPLYNFRPYK